MRISTAGGDTINEKIDFVRNECTFEPTDSISFHVGINTILQNPTMREADLINMVMEYEDLVEATKVWFPSTRRIQLSEIFTLGPAKKWTMTTRARLNTTIGKINHLLAVMATNDVNIIRHVWINSTDGVHARDGLHFNEHGIGIFTKDLSNSLISSYSPNFYPLNFYSFNSYSH